MDGDNRMFALPVARYEAVGKLEPFLAEITERDRQAALEAFLPAMQERYRQLLRVPRRDFEARIGHGDDILRDLQQDGYALRGFGESARSRIRGLIEPLHLEIMGRLDSLGKLRFSDGQVALDPAQHARLYLEVDKALNECGALPAFSAYAGRPLGLLRLVAQVNTARETRKKYGEIDASGLPEHRTSYWHVDSTDWPTIKALIYVSDVDLDQGPFRIVKGSHRLMGDFESVVRKTNDKLRQRPARFLSLPFEFGQHASFGDWIDETTQGAAELLAAEAVVGDGASDLVMFDNNGVHRGGFVRSGRRFMLQCHFAQADRIIERRVGSAAASAALESA